MRQQERRQQIEWVRWFGYQYPEYVELLHHSPNGGSRNKIEAAHFKAMGTRAGFPDLFLAVPSNGFHGLFLELKTTKGRLSDNQKHYHELLRKQGYHVEVVKDFDTFKVVLENYIYKKL